jgi:anti-anti-sigma regulatory factor
MTRLEWKTEGGESGQRVLAEGAITEQSDLEALEEALQGATVLDLAGIEYINSFGVREWLGFVERLKGLGLEAQRCSPAVVQQINSIQGFVDGLKVTSVLAPFLCTRCDRYDTVEVDVSDPDKIEIEETRECPECSGEMEFDELIDAFLAFTQRG